MLRNALFLGATFYYFFWNYSVASVNPPDRAICINALGGPATTDQLLQSLDLKTRILEDARFWGQGLSALDPEHLVDVFLLRASMLGLSLKAYVEMAHAPESDSTWITELKFFSQTFSRRTGGVKSMPMMGEHKVLMAPLHEHLRTELALELGLRRPHFVRIVGLGRPPSEPRDIARLLNQILDDDLLYATSPDILNLSKVERKIEAATRLDFRFRLYDKDPDVLRDAQVLSHNLEREFPFLRGRINVSYLDITETSYFSSWAESESLIIMARNSYRDRLADLASGFVHHLPVALMGGGVFITDREAAFSLSYFPFKSVGLYKKAVVGLEGTENQGVVLVRAHLPFRR